MLLEFKSLDQNSTIAQRSVSITGYLAKIHFELHTTHECGGIQFTGW